MFRQVMVILEKIVVLILQDIQILPSMCSWRCVTSNINFLGIGSGGRGQVLPSQMCVCVCGGGGVVAYLSVPPPPPPPTFHLVLLHDESFFAILYLNVKMQKKILTRSWCDRKHIILFGIDFGRKVSASVPPPSPRIDFGRKVSASVPPNKKRFLRHMRIEITIIKKCHTSFSLEIGHITSLLTQADFVGSKVGHRIKRNVI